MDSFNWFLIHYGDGRRGSGMRNGRHDSRIHGGPGVTSCPYLTKSAFSMMT